MSLGKTVTPLGAAHAVKVGVLKHLHAAVHGHIALVGHIDPIAVLSGNLVLRQGVRGPGAGVRAAVAASSVRATGGHRAAALVPARPAPAAHVRTPLPSVITQAYSSMVSVHSSSMVLAGISRTASAWKQPHHMDPGSEVEVLFSTVRSSLHRLLENTAEQEEPSAPSVPASRAVGRSSVL